MPFLTDAKSLAAIRDRNRAAPGLARPRARGAFPVLQQPDLQRGRYAARLRSEYVAEAEKLLLRKLSPLLAQLAAEYERQQSEEAREDSWRGDAEPEDVRRVFEGIARDFLRRMPNARVAELARTTAQETSTFHRAQLRAAFRAHLSIDVDALFAEEPGLRRAVDDFTVENVALIRTVSSRYFAQVEEVVLEAVTKGMRPEKLAERLVERAGVAESNAARIANDQVGKFYGALNGTRQQALGVRRYRWRTMRDNRVRDEHQQRNGAVFSWDKPPPDGHPGHPINCRCWSEPVIDDVLAEELTAAVEDKTPRAPEAEGWQRLGRARTPPAPRAPRPPRPQRRAIPPRPPSLNRTPAPLAPTPPTPARAQPSPAPATPAAQPSTPPPLPPLPKESPAPVRESPSALARAVSPRGGKASPMPTPVEKRTSRKGWKPDREYVVPVAELDDIPAAEWSPSKTRELEAAVRFGLWERLPPIRVGEGTDGLRELEDGNHRLALARRLGLSTIRVRFLSAEAAELRPRAHATEWIAKWP